MAALDVTSLGASTSANAELDWLNEQLGGASSSTATASTSSLAALDGSLSSTLATLEAHTSDTSLQVSSMLHSISLSVPRLTFDLQLMRESALLLKLTLEGLKKRSSKESDTKLVMERLQVLDLVKSRMEAVRDVLREAESWSTLESDVLALLGEKAYARSAQRLEEAARSLVVFQNTAEYEARRALLLSLQNTLEASLSASLVSAISTRDIAACRSYRDIFGKIERDNEFTAYYFGSRRAAITASWAEAALSDCGSAGVDKTPTMDEPLSRSATKPTTTFNTFLARFYADFQVLLSEEKTYIPAIFPGASSTLSAFVQTTLDALSPSFQQRLAGVVEHYKNKALPELIQAYKATEEFALGVERTFATLESGGFSLSSSQSHDTPSKQQQRDRRSTSKRLSMSSKRLSSKSISIGSFKAGAPFGGEEGSQQPSQGSEPLEWETTLFEPFLALQATYENLESDFILSEIKTATGGDDPTDFLAVARAGAKDAAGAQLLQEQVGHIFTLAESAIGRSLAFTHGFGAAGLVKVLDRQVARFLERRSDLLSRGPEGVRRARLRGNLRNATKDQDAGNIQDQDVDLDFEMSSEDWEIFQLCLSLLETCRFISERVAAMEARLKARMVLLASTMRGLAIDGDGASIPGTTRGAVLLLKQSTLNSRDLAELLDPLAPPPSDGAAAPARGISPPLLTSARRASTELTRATQLFLHETVLAPLFTHLAAYPSLAVWSSAGDSRPGGGGKGAFDLDIPTFSLSPTELIARVGEGLFNLPRLFEIYAAEDDAFAFSLETLPFVDPETMKAIKSVTAGGGVGGQTPRMGHASRMSVFATTPVSASEEFAGAPGASPRRPNTTGAGEATPPQQQLSAEIVISAWLTSLTSSVLSHLVSVSLPSLTRLTAHGAAQLASDLGYIGNVARTLDSEPGVELDSWLEACGWDDEEGRSRWREAGVGDKEKEARARVARLRGWSR